MKAYYNENDPYAAAWLRELIKENLIAPGDVDERSIEDVTPNDLNGYTQHHFFAGIGVWSYALRQAGWPDDRPVWTGSCPCQGFSVAGKGKGFADERHLWPAWFHLISVCHPSVVFGEQVESKIGLAWLDLVQADLEGVGYACGAIVAPAAGFGAPHIRSRQYWAAQRLGEPDNCGHGEFGNNPAGRREPECGRADGGLVNNNTGSQGHPRDGGGGGEPGREQTNPFGSVGEGGSAGRVAGWSRPGPVNGFWRDADWLFCRDGKWRPAQPQIFPLADGSSSRVGLLRGAGNAIVAPQAQAFIEAYLEIESYK